MSNAPIPTKSIKFRDFDFSVDRSRILSAEPHDGSVTIRMAGKNRKTANHELVFVPYFKKHNVKFKTVAIGRHKKRTQTPIVVFDQHELGQESAVIRKYEKLGGIVNSKGHALKILGLFKIPLPEKADEVVKIYFKLHPTLAAPEKLNYRICILSLMKVIKNDAMPIPPAKLKKKKSAPIKKSNREKRPKKEKSVPTNIL